MSDYETIVADPPWRYTVEKRPQAAYARGAAESHYETMRCEDIAALPVAEWAAPVAHLYLWVTNIVLTEQRTEGWSGADIVRAWGFEPKTVITWLKPQPGLGFFFRGHTEHAIFAVRGGAAIPAELREPNYFTAPRTSHSTKPDSFYDMVERVSPEPRLEMFARRARLSGWDYWGAEALATP